MSLPPLTFKPILKPRAWGGDTLQGFGKSLIDQTPTGESWELADLPDSIADGRSMIQGGPFGGWTLGEALRGQIVQGWVRPATEVWPSMYVHDELYLTLMVYVDDMKPCWACSH